MKESKSPMPERPWLLRSLVVGVFVIAGVVTMKSVSTLTLGSPYSWLGGGFGEGWMPAQVSSALLHYATSTVTPQQSRGEMEVAVRVLARRNPANFLVFGVGHDSPLWNALNFRGLTVFLEEDSKWIKDTLTRHPLLNHKAFHVTYPTTLSQADNLLRYYRSDAACSPLNPLKASTCKLALADLPDQIYDTEWDVIMIDAPRGYFDAAPGRMTAIFSSAVMAANRKKDGETDIFLHDVDRRVEKMYAHEFLCKPNLVASSGRLWHFSLPKLNPNATAAAFCNH